MEPVTKLKATMSAEETFWSYVDRDVPDDECWIWKGRMKGFYPIFYFDSKTHSARRIAYCLHQGCHWKDYRLLPNLTMSCYEDSCCNPSHMRLVKTRE